MGQSYFPFLFPFSLLRVKLAITCNKSQQIQADQFFLPIDRIAEENFSVFLFVPTFEKCDGIIGFFFGYFFCFSNFPGFFYC